MRDAGVSTHTQKCRAFEPAQLAWEGVSNQNFLIDNNFLFENRCCDYISEDVLYNHIMNRNNSFIERPSPRPLDIGWLVRYAIAGKGGMPLTREEWENIVTCRVISNDPNECTKNESDVTILSSSYDREKFSKYMREEKQLRPKTITSMDCYARKFVQAKKEPEEFLKQYANPNSYNNAVKAIRHYYRFLKLPIPNAKIIQVSSDSLIIAPKKEEVIGMLRRIEPKEVRAYLALCATCGLRPERLLNLKWREVDFANSIININENVRTKKYRPNPLHKDVAQMLNELHRSDERVFNFSYRRILTALNKVGTKIRRNNLRDFFYNEARRCGMDRDLVEWLMGHDIGIKQHYLADDIKEQYLKFEKIFIMPCADQSEPKKVISRWCV